MTTSVVDKNSFWKRIISPTVQFYPDNEWASIYDPHKGKLQEKFYTTCELLKHGILAAFDYC